MEFRICGVKESVSDFALFGLRDSGFLGLRVAVLEWFRDLWVVGSWGSVSVEGFGVGVGVVGTV